LILQKKKQVSSMNLSGDVCGVVDEEDGEVGGPEDQVQPGHLFQAAILASTILRGIKRFQNL